MPLLPIHQKRHIWAHGTAKSTVKICTAKAAVTSGLNAGWLGAASGIGVSLALQHWPRGNWITPNRGAILLSTICGYGATVVLTLGVLANLNYPICSMAVNKGFGSGGVTFQVLVFQVLFEAAASKRARYSTMLHFSQPTCQYPNLLASTPNLSLH